MQAVKKKSGMERGSMYIKRKNFSGVSVAAYKRLLAGAIGAAVEAGCGEASTAAELVEAGLAPHLAKVYSIWPRQQKKSMEKIAAILSKRKAALLRRKKSFSLLRKRLGDGVLDSLFRVSEYGEIVFDRGELPDGVKLSKSEVEACLSMYPIYTLVLGAPKEVKAKLAETLALKLS